jgi:predicted mannosyl-3-phosphoglycerate phosphatase (HAD superfamily)
MKLHQPHVFSDVRAEGVYVYFSEADAVDVNGTLYAEVGGSLHNAKGWHETKEAAREEAAAKVAEMAERLAAQAVRIRAGGR